MTIRHTEIFLVRHGQTDSNVARLFDGATDTPLNRRGLRQAELVAERIGQLADLTSLYSSPLQRALFTAQAISRSIGLQPVLDPGLQEMNFGIAENHTMATIIERWPELAAQIQNPDESNVVFPGGESLAVFHQRIRMTLDLIATANQGQRIVVVAHGGVIRSAVSQLLGRTPDDWRTLTVENCSITHVELASSGSIAHVVNDVVHLESLTVEQVSETLDQ
ncbi:MAG TPA: histidine phosphatase family protein [Thermomicrobiales bacterium]|nr:histidine phosphatase family protein [Chloroflexota bacterium]HBY46411.1 histidine phosphatase family protein [Chloroflexota bacterium]HCG29546.1 histidine phosphatase family protein [Chloroflexota bacterium]HQZ89577.1 histidine phosphatase family protein [Thermomicrobiales bacterium]HRA31158.1 histidine phosphatase family protein [Thermomicrobiales bacterium]